MNDRRISHLVLLTALLCTSVVAQAQTIPVIGSDTSLDVVTWNIESFGGPGGPSNDELQRQNVLAVIQQADADLYSLQELNDETTFNTLLNELGSDWEGVRVEGGSIGYGYIYKTDVIQSLQVNQILTGSAYEFAQRPPLLLRADVMLPDTTIEIRFIDVHMKCCSGEEDYERRVAASQILKNYVDNLIFIDEHVMILGDLNDELIQSIHGGCDGQPTCPSPYQNFLDDEDYFFVTRSFDEPGFSNDTFTFCSNSSCSNGSVLDHIITTRNL
ncbi:MAG: endonuclease/exonuclease/phosphatase family protein, partial [Rubricoccaceae bacterium]|nr:endonuclease/exonuclease/phosphatase family protein [Rubricoccaceae bacterium]